MEDYRTRTISGLTLRIDRTLCIGSGNCVSVAPEVWQLDEENLVAFQDDAPDIERERLVESCELCPVEALAAYDEAGEQLAP